MIVAVKRNSRKRAILKILTNCIQYSEVFYLHNLTFSIHTVITSTVMKGIQKAVRAETFLRSSHAVDLRWPSAQLHLSSWLWLASSQRLRANCMKNEWLRQPQSLPLWPTLLGRRKLLIERDRERSPRIPKDQNLNFFIFGESDTILNLLQLMKIWKNMRSNEIWKSIITISIENVSVIWSNLQKSNISAFQTIEVKKYS